MIPDFTQPEELNRLLSLLANAGGSLSLDSVIDLLSSTVVYGRSFDPASTIDAASLANLVSQTESRIFITELGRQLLALNGEAVYELSPGQAQFVYINLVQREPFLSVVRSLLSLFRPRGIELSLSLEISIVEISRDQSTMLSLLRRLGVVSISRGIVTICKEYLPYTSATKARRRLTVDQLEQLLEERKLRGAAAEQLVYRAERERLFAAGHEIEAAAVKIVSDYDIAAGYDIESFEGNSASLTPDRFIEVKSTISEKGTFFWSANERATAEELAEKYWICHVRGFSTENTTRHPFIWIRDPADKVNTGDLAIRCSQFEASFELDNADDLM